MTYQVDLDFFTHKLDLSAIKIEHAHCTGGSNDGKPQMIIIGLLSYKGREAILNRAMYRRIQGDFINLNFSGHVAKICKGLRNQVHTLKADGITAYISYDRIRIKKDQTNVDVGPRSLGSCGGSTGRGHGHSRGGGGGSTRVGHGCGAPGFGSLQGGQTNDNFNGRHNSVTKNPGGTPTA